MTLHASVPEDGSFRHEALLYEGEAGFLAGTVPFLEDALAAGEPVLVVVDAAKIEALQDALGADAEAVRFADMAEVGRNPARIIPAWRRFVDEQAAEGVRFRGIGEPIWPGRESEELAECHRHEALLNLAFAGSPAWWLLCPYDVQALEPAIVEEARRNHPFVSRNGSRLESLDYPGAEVLSGPFDAPLPDPPEGAAELRFEASTLSALRRLVAGRATAFGLDERRTFELTVAVNEAATNSVMHGGGEGLLRVWDQDRTVVCEVSDRGTMNGSPLVGREIPTPADRRGRGLWLANQLCDLVQVRSLPEGTVVRIHVCRAG